MSKQLVCDYCDKTIYQIIGATPDKRVFCDVYFEYSISNIEDNLTEQSKELDFCSPDCFDKYIRCNLKGK
jgi:hypothetical protein